MLDELYMQDLANAMRMPEEVVPAGKVTVSAPEPEMAATADMPQTGVRVGRAGISPEQSAKAGGLDRPLVALLDTLAGALKGATAQTLGLPGDIRSILDMINKEGAQKYLGDPVLPTTERMQEILPAVVPQGVANQADREQTAKTFSEVGTFLPAPGAPEAAIQGVKAVGKAIKATKNMPVGMSTQAVGQGMDELGFYSAAKQAVDAIQQPKGTGAQFLAQISKTPGVKPDEIKWTGLDEFLQSKKSVTKAEVQEYLDKNRVQIKEVKLGEPDEGEIQALLNDEMGQGMTRQDAIDYLANDEGSLAPKFSKYTLPGGENYREVLLTLPSKNPEFDPKDIGRLNDLSNKTRTPAEDVEYKSLAQRYDASLRGETTPEFKSGHFDQPNILAHIRVNDRVIDGKKTLFVEEVQSDWHQVGRKKGYASADKPYEVFDPKDGKPIATFATEKEAKAYADELGPQVDYAKSEGVPDAPFKTTWSDLSMKRVIQMASEGGYDRIAFTTGKTQAERFDLSKQVDTIAYRPDGNGTFEISAVKDGNSVMTEYGKTVDDIEELVGKDIAKKVANGEGDLASGFRGEKGGVKELSGVDLQVGGEGMKGFYDDILPKFLDKYAKKWDAKTGVTEMPVGKGKPTQYADFDEYSKAPSQSSVSVNYIDVTPKMRESVVTKGQPMFAIGAGGAGAAATQEENK